MATARSVIWGITKWLLIPATLAGVGYTIYGPMIGKQPPKSLVKLQERIVANQEPETSPIEAAAAADSEEEAPKYTPPEVDVNVLKRDGRVIRDRQDIPGVNPEGEGVEVEAEESTNSDSTELQDTGSASNL